MEVTMSEKKVNVEKGKKGFQKVVHKTPKAPTASPRTQANTKKADAIRQQLLGDKVGRGGALITNDLVNVATGTGLSPVAIIKRNKARKELEEKFGSINWN